MRAESRFTAMGTSAHVVVIGDPRLLERAEARVRDLESRWSRFLENSEISRMNRAAGAPTVVSCETWDLVHRSVAAWKATRCLFDPSVHDTLVALGYDRPRTRDSDARGAAAGEPGDTRATRPTRRTTATDCAHRPTPASGLSNAVLDRATSTVWFRSGTRIDVGGIAKGYAADLVATELLTAGAQGALVNLGGDLRVAGCAPDGAWSIAVEDPSDRGHDLRRVAITRGGVATSSCVERIWQFDGRLVHHLIDPRTGQPARSDAVAATVFAGEAWWAEALTKPLMVLGVRAGLSMLATSARASASAIVVDTTGSVHCTPDLALTEVAS